MTNRNDIEQLFKAHYAEMRRLAVALLHDDDLSRDIVHDVFATLLDGDSLLCSGRPLRFGIQYRTRLRCRQWQHMISGGILAYSKDSDEICYELAHKLRDSSYRCIRH